MDTINISLNKAITVRMKSTLKQKGYNNISEYIRDLLRRDLYLEAHDSYHYDERFLEELNKEAKVVLKKKKTKQLTTLDDLRK